MQFCPAIFDARQRSLSSDAKDLLNQLSSIVGSRHVLSGSIRTLPYRSGFRFGIGSALAVVRPSTLVQQWKVLRACVAASKILIIQAANTGLTGGSTPDRSGYDREVVIINTLRIARIRLISGGRQVICHSGSTLLDLEKALTPLGREPHSVIGSSCIGASVIGGICNGSGGALVRRGPAYTELAMFARVDERGNITLINHLGIHLGTDPEEMLARLDEDAYTEGDIEYNFGRQASDQEYSNHVRACDAETASRYNADPRRLFEASGCAGKLMIFAVRLDTFAKDNETRVFYVGTNDPKELTEIRRHILTHFKALPVSAEYLHRNAFNMAESYGKDTFLAVWYLGGQWLPRIFRLKCRFDSFVSRVRLCPRNLGDRILQLISSLYPSHLPKRITEYRDKYAHHLLLKMPDMSIGDARQFLQTFFPSVNGDFFECTDEEGRKAFLHRFVAAGAGIRYRALHNHEVEGMIALDIALRRNDRDWFETLPHEIALGMSHLLYYGHFFCHVFHHDYIVRKGYSVAELENGMWRMLEERGAQFPAEHSFGHLYHATPALVSHFQTLDPTNCFNSGIGRTTKAASWRA